MHQATSDRAFDVWFFNKLDINLRFTLRWYRLIEDNLRVEVCRPGFVAVQPYEWSRTVIWWDSSGKKRKKTVASKEDESYVGPVNYEAEFEENKDEEDDDGDGVAAGTSGSVGPAAHPLGDS